MDQVHHDNDSSPEKCSDCFCRDASKQAQHNIKTLQDDADGIPCVASGRATGLQKDEALYHESQHGEDVPRGKAESGGHKKVKFEDQTRNLISFTRIPKGFSTIYEAAQAHCDLQQISKVDSCTRQKSADVKMRNHVHACAEDLRNVSFTVDTSIDNRENEKFRKEIEKLSRMLNRQQLRLLERQAELLQLRMSIINAMMEFDEESRLIENEICRVQEQDCHSVIDESMSASGSFKGTTDVLQSDGQSVDATWPQTASDFTDTGSSHILGRQRRLSCDIHTIEEMQEESSHSALPVLGLSSTIVNHPSDSPDIAAPIDRWDMSLSTHLTADPINFEPNGGRMPSYSGRRMSFSHGLYFASCSDEESLLPLAKAGTESADAKTGTGSLDRKS